LELRERGSDTYLLWTFVHDNTRTWNAVYMVNEFTLICTRNR